MPLNNIGKSPADLSLLGPLKTGRVQAGKPDCPLLTQGHKHNGMTSRVENLGKTLCTDSSDWVTPTLFSFLGAAVTETVTEVSFSV